MNEFPYVSYQTESPVAQLLAEGFRSQYEQFADHGGDENWREPRSTLIILDWMYDPVIPVMHDFTYASLVSDFIGINDHKEVTVKTGAQAVYLGDEEEKWPRGKTR